MCTHSHTVVALFSLLSHNHIIKKTCCLSYSFSHLLSPSYIFTISHSYNFLTTFLSHFLYNHIHVMIEIGLSSSQRTTPKLRKKSHMGYSCETTTEWTFNNAINCNTTETTILQYTFYTF